MATTHVGPSTPISIASIRSRRPSQSKGFNYVVCGAGIQGCPPVPFLRPGTEHKYWRLRNQLYPLADSNAVGAGQGDIKQDEINGMSLKHMQRLFAV
jgi:hypothetical protein